MTVEQLVEGLMIIAKYDPQSEVDATEDHLWLGDLTVVMNNATEEELDRLRELGFLEKPGMGSAIL